MQEHLKTNILNFKWPSSTPTIYLSLAGIENISRSCKSSYKLLVFIKDNE
ncbi:hypothetical protein [Snuella lapsa]